MYSFLNDEIKKRLSIDRKYVSNRAIQDNYLLLLYLKYLCVKNKVIDYKDTQKLLSLVEDTKKELYDKFFEKNMNELLVHLELSNIEEMLKEYIDNIKFDTLEEIDSILINKEDKVLYCINKIDNNDRVLTSYSYHDSNLYKKRLEIIDEMLNNKREYFIDINDKDLNDINTLVVVDKEAAYRYLYATNIIDVINNIFIDKKEFNGKIILKTSYSKISIIKNSSILRKYLKVVLLYEDNEKNDCILVFDKEEKKNISIVMIKKEMEKDYEKIRGIITKNVANKNYLLKVTPDNIIANNYRIGFKMYLSSNNEEAKSINDIIDENTKILEEITRLNKFIQEEMDKLVAK